MMTNGSTLVDVAEVNTSIDYNLTTSERSVTGQANARSLSPEDLPFLFDVQYYTQGVLFTLFCSIGIITNVLNMTTLVRQRKTATIKIFIGMALADFMISSILISYSISLCYSRSSPTPSGPPGLVVPYSLYVWSVFWHLTNNIFMCVSSWCSVLLSLFRLLVITFPLQAPILASKPRVNLSILTVYICSFIAQIPNWVTYRFNDSGAIERNSQFLQSSTITVVLNLPLPLTICLICTIGIILQLKKGEKFLKGSLREDQMKERSMEQRQLTVTLNLVVILFIVLNLPSMSYSIMDQQKLFDKYNVPLFDEVIFYLAASTLNMMSYTLNFFIYITTNRSFRRDFLRSWRTLIQTISRHSAHSVSSSSGPRSKNSHMPASRSSSNVPSGIHRILPSIVSKEHYHSVSQI